MHRLRSCVVLLMLVVLLALSSCEKGCGERHPYVPYRIEPGVDAAQATASIALPESGPPADTSVAALAPPKTTTWPVEGLVLRAPAGRVFVSALVGDVNGDGIRDAFAFVRNPESALELAELVFYRGKTDGVGAAEVVDLPKDLAPRVDCIPMQRLVRAGARGVWIEVGSTCSAPRDGASRFVALLRAGSAVSSRFAAAVTDDPNAPVLSFEPAAVDVDHDGTDDLVLRISLEGGGPPFEPAPRVTAVARWMDRPSGLSADAAAMEGSFVAIASTAASRSVRIKEAGTVPLLVGQLRALFGALCGAHPRVVPKSGSAALACNSSRALEDGALAEVRAYVTLGDPLRASAALHRMDSGAVKTRLDDARGWIQGIAPVRLARSIRLVVAVLSMDSGRGPAWGPLAFDAEGRLLVRTAAGVARLDPTTGEIGAAPVAVWPLAVRSTDGALRWLTATDPCDGSPICATFDPTGTCVPLPIAPLLSATCSGKGEPMKTVPIAWGAAGLEALVAGEPVVIHPERGRAVPLRAMPEQPVTLGAPRSPDGRVLVVATSLGLLVKTASSSQLLRASELDGTYESQQGCVVSNDGARAACARGGKGWVGIWELPALPRP
ncbi:MAG: hypothetical protein WCI05_01265 [Myxococcales bacterium]